MSPLIYSIEDDTNIGYIINRTLTSAQYDVKTFPDGKQFWTAFSSTKPDLILLDLMLPDIDGIELHKKIRKESKVPVIIISARNYEVDKVIGLDSGADDYITKPFGALELISRVKVALRKTDKMTTTIFQLKSLTLDKNKRTCSILQQEIALTSKEFDLLYHLLENQGKVIRRDELFKEIWGYDFMGETRTLDMHINFLRKKIIQADPTLANIIKTIRGVGYMVNCDD